MKWGASFDSSSLDNFERFRFARSANYRNTGFYNPCLFKGDFVQCISEPLLMIELNIRDDAQERIHDIRRIQPSTQTCFPDYNVAFLASEILQRHDGHNLKKCRRSAGGKVGSQFADFGNELHHRLFRDQFPIDLNPLAEANQMG